MTRQEMQEIDDKLNPCTLPGNWGKPGMCSIYEYKYVICYDSNNRRLESSITTAFCDTAEEATDIWNNMFPKDKHAN